MICIIKTEKARGNAGNTSRFSTASLADKGTIMEKGSSDYNQIVSFARELSSELKFSLWVHLGY